MPYAFLNWGKKKPVSETRKPNILLNNQLVMSICIVGMKSAVYFYTLDYYYKNDLGIPSGATNKYQG
jgi:hypothetical protein